ncbi:hypothetical protein V5O48_017268 [Marasmius crinis-equi]|uniref:Uncharacterized protein n=1 Tax=Marasmius crinis-equi TaxID=585013 RepID=A0ABR3EPG5_9AGAR
MEHAESNSFLEQVVKDCQDWSIRELEATREPLESILTSTKENLKAVSRNGRNLQEASTAQFSKYTQAFRDRAERIESALNNIDREAENAVEILLWIGIQTEIIRILQILILLPPGPQPETDRLLALIDSYRSHIADGGFAKLTEVYIEIQTEALNILNSTLEKWQGGPMVAEESK